MMLLLIDLGDYRACRPSIIIIQYPYTGPAFVKREGNFQKLFSYSGDAIGGLRLVTQDIQCKNTTSVGSRSLCLLPVVDELQQKAACINESTCIE